MGKTSAPGVGVRDPIGSDLIGSDWIGMRQADLRSGCGVWDRIRLDRIGLDRMCRRQTCAPTLRTLVLWGLRVCGFGGLRFRGLGFRLAARTRCAQQRGFWFFACHLGLLAGRFLISCSVIYITLN